ncbi:MAG TPA: HAD family phosphatase [Trebonia sp.]|jgi:putative hydrolase of the HAD superfamily|nr:HAD family phosphatase [Trebonia sp.]
MTIRAVVFDAGNVLELTDDAYDLAEWAAIAGLAPEELTARIGGVFDGADVGTVTLAQVHRRLGGALGIGDGQVQAIMENLWRVYLGTPNTGLITWARGLRPRYKTGILSNSSVGAREREHARYGYGDLFDDIVYSHEVGLVKPDPRIYALCCQRLEVAPAEVAFLDDREVNVAAARAAGLHAVHFRGATPGEATMRAIAEITGLLAGL